MRSRCNGSCAGTEPSRRRTRKGAKYKTMLRRLSMHCSASLARVILISLHPPKPKQIPFFSCAAFFTARTQSLTYGKKLSSYAVCASQGFRLSGISVTGMILQISVTDRLCLRHLEDMFSAVEFVANDQLLPFAGQHVGL